MHCSSRLQLASCASRVFHGTRRLASAVAPRGRARPDLRCPHDKRNFNWSSRRLFDEPAAQPALGATIARSSRCSSSASTGTPEGEFTPGAYRIVNRVAVHRGIGLTENKFAQLHVGESIDVTEVIHLEEEQRIRARLKEPDGWISLVDTSDGFQWAIRDLDPFDVGAWAACPEVYGHAHSRPARQAFEPSQTVWHGDAVAPHGWGVEMVSHAGLKTPSGLNPNQDAFSTTLTSNDWIICVVCDGHGLHGEVVAERVASALPLILVQLLLAMGPRAALSAAFAETQAHLERSLAREQFHSGATVATCLVHKSRPECWFAHCGDSRTVLGDFASGQAVVCTQDHNPGDAAEFQRLQLAGAKVLTKEYEGGEIVGRVFVPGTDAPGLAVSRALGDGCLKTYGVTAEPDVQDVSKAWASCRAPGVLIASDGLWNVIDPEDAVASLARRRRMHLSLRDGAKALCQRAQETMTNLKLDQAFSYCDDVTVALVAPPAILHVDHDDFVQSEIHRFAAKKPHRCSLQEILGMPDVEHLARFIHDEVPVRYAERIRAIELLPGWEQNADLKEVYQRHVQTFRDIRLIQKAESKRSSLSDPLTLVEFDGMIRNAAIKGQDVQLLVARAMYTLRLERPEVFTTEFVDRWLDDFLLNYIGTETLLMQYLARLEGRPNGIIDPRCDVAAVCRDVASTVQDVCMDLHQRRPQVIVESFSAVEEDQRAPSFSYIPMFLKYVMMEILKNSCRATLVTCPYEKLPKRPTSVAVCADEHQVAIRVSDRGRGIPFHVGNNIWSYMYSTRHKAGVGFLEGATPLAGYGIGLPLSRLYVRYLGGSLGVVSWPGLGCDVHLSLPRLSSEQVEVVPDQDN
mmetsp:Transcript_111889/g.316143  ORF Transcript_111889/g.316143 Transcript_111889/m.316143 type:complete len:857 (-) Transcript_111889:134-2704(-)